jgi:hypothetical protein
MPNLDLIAQIINKFGDHEHPEASASNLIFFETPYVTACIQKALASGRLSEAGMAEAKRWLDPGYKPKAKRKTLVRW